MDMQTLSEQKTQERFERHTARTARSMGWGDTEGALGVTKEFLTPLTAHINNAIENLNQISDRDPLKGFVVVLRQLSPDVIALCTLNTALHDIAAQFDYRESCLGMGRAIAAEAFAAGLLKHDAKLAARIGRSVKQRHGSVEYRRRAARSAARAAGFMGTRWSNTALLQAGHWLWSCLFEACPEGFVMAEDGRGYAPTLTEGALETAYAAIDRVLRDRPVMLPMLEAPEPWSDINKGGYRDARARTSHRMRFVRTYHQDTVAAVRDAMRDGSMQPAVDAVNGLQAVAWTINRPVLDVVRWCYEAGVDVKGLPPKGDIALPEHPKAWDAMSEDEQRSWKLEFAEVKQKNRSFISDRVAFQEDMSTADIMADKDAFWTPYNCDWRGRVYPMCHFNFQRDDRVRALFLFRDGEPLGDDGLFWLKVHVANCGDFDKISKRPLAERAAWVDTNWSLISETAANPYGTTAWWTQADKPFLFLAACLEIVEAVERGGICFVTHLPVSWDGSCSGLQHLCAMTRAPEGSLVNLTTSPLPQDVYSTVADRLVTRLERVRDGTSFVPPISSLANSPTSAAESNSPSPNVAMALAWLTFLENTNRRKVVKRNVMTYSYSSKKSGMTEQHVEDLMRPLRTKVLRKELGEHPFGDREGQWEAARFIAGHIYEAIEEIVHLPAAAMTFLQRIARAMAHESKPVRWTAPTGFPWINRYHELDVKTVELWMHDTRIRLRVAEGAKKEINRTKAANGVAPNFVHACDAAHLMLTVNASRAEGIHNIATVHDSFGCLASQATRFNAIIREQFVRMYETHDVLAEVLEQSKCDLTVHNGYRLPEVPRKGPLDLKEVINAQYAFA